ncbi:hypothetical protein N9X25_09390 [Verrucomicrobiales bacterium]|nr:hypothetical protein [Verrucomicrobiales bacterium]
MTLKELGWNPQLEAAFELFRAKGWVPARLIRETTINYGAFIAGDELEEVEVVLCGRAWHEAENDAELPAVGDWVAVELGGVRIPTASFASACRAAPALRARCRAMLPKPR